MSTKLKEQHHGVFAQNFYKWRKYSLNLWNNNVKKTQTNGFLSFLEGSFPKQKPLLSGFLRSRYVFEPLTNNAYTVTITTFQTKSTCICLHRHRS